MSIGASIEALAETAGIAVRDGLQVGALSALAPDPTYPALLLIDAIIVPSPSTPISIRYRGTTDRGGEREPVHRGARNPSITRCRESPTACPCARPAPHIPRSGAARPYGTTGVIARLRDPARGCPWDLEQDHRTLRPHLLEETYEVLQALDRDDRHALCEELGDLMMQVFLHAQIAEEDGQFDIDDVAEGIRAKLIRRHPHVFGGVKR